MLKLLRRLLLPFSALYWLITAIRNLLYDWGVYTSHSFPLPVIAVGNLSTGGTGKTPQTEYLIRLLGDRYRIATLSRGYGRKTNGFIIANENAAAQTIGDEPYQFYSKFPNITVAVDANRVNGVTNLLNLNPKPEIILLDDAYQHRRLKAGFYILLTAYSEIYPDDFILPAGNLRESRTGAHRANVIVVTKCPPDLSDTEQQRIIKKLKPKPSQKVFFTCIDYDDLVYSEKGVLHIDDATQTQRVLVAGIAKPQYFFEVLAGPGTINKQYPDHHEFTETELNELNQLANERIIITTEKDYTRLKGKLPADSLYYLPISSMFINGGDDFDNTILTYVGKSTANR
ncbi:tetraacyldisaccharide 4'-kinase [Flavobacterium akiainvivens]|uniref:Tetraacyldisaccharide 4'-kinase n=1 Tax=Flavobacterium akiainvivens TaxID=1202724 RepID=A0A0M8MCW3_9FLAO|nr:tetraacyldisaccharide 4'-kinase [Flavobacterium akiainvivens]KOS06154.1 tetraacyldisaccharide 4'-kinase [Flavobacterium akiainvivens]SFQ67997.1 lipid-A-disaccharide kinase [Flavobacterium akiainvivens]